MQIGGEITTTSTSFDDLPNDTIWEICRWVANMPAASDDWIQRYGLWGILYSVRQTSRRIHNIIAKAIPRDMKFPVSIMAANAAVNGYDSPIVNDTLELPISHTDLLLAISGDTDGRIMRHVLDAGVKIERGDPNFAVRHGNILAFCMMADSLPIASFVDLIEPAENLPLSLRNCKFMGLIILAMPEGWGRLILVITKILKNQCCDYCNGKCETKLYMLAECHSIFNGKFTIEYFAEKYKIASLTTRLYFARKLERANFLAEKEYYGAEIVESRVDMCLQILRKRN